MPNRKIRRDTRQEFASTDERQEMLIAHPFFENIFPDEEKTEIRILIVADGSLAFDERYFGLSELIDKALLPSAMPWEKFTIVTAHRSCDDRTSDLPGFRFDDVRHPFNIKRYDQVWLFGHHGKDASDAIKKDSAELKALTNFMNAGGGVFATGDHWDLGAAMCGELPRVRKMRKWRFFETDIPKGEKAPDTADSTRIDTLREGIDPGFQLDDQSDYVPQEIYPTFRMSNSCAVEPHYLLSYGRDAIKVLPDHMHEGECVVPTNLNTTYECDGEEYEEFPPATISGQRISPEAVAVGLSAGGYFSANPIVRPVEPRSYYVITAYDGHLANSVVNGKRREGCLGRVVVDATFHHFVNINLNGAGSHNPQKTGFYDSNGNPTKEYRAIKQYYRNILTWLCPPPLKLKYYNNMLLALRYMSPLIEEIRPIEEPGLKDILHAGAITNKAITERFSRVEAKECAWATLCLRKQEKRMGLEKFINLALSSDLFTEDLHLFFNFDVMEKAFLGGAMLGIAKKHPESSSDVNEELEESKSSELEEWKSSQEDLETLIADGVEHSLSVLEQTIGKANVQLGELSALLSAKPGSDGS